MIKSSVLSLCSGKSRRTQMAEGFLSARAGDEFDVFSAGSEETQRDADAIAAMREVGIDVSGQETKAVTRSLGRRFSYVVTLCNREKERSCPIFSGAIWRLQWDLEDPSRVPSPDDRRGAMRRARDEIQRQVRDFLKNILKHILKNILKNIVENIGMTKGKEQRHEPCGEGAST